MGEANESRVRRAMRRSIPWISLTVGILSALYMQRGPGRGAIVAAASLLLWVGLVVSIWLGRVNDNAQTGRGAKLIGGARWSSLLLTQSTLHLQFFFALPFYVEAYAQTLGHAVFVAMVAAGASASLWDPLTEWLLTRTRFGIALPAFASFVALAAVLPGVGLNNGHSLWIAAGASSLALPVVLIADRLGRDRRDWLSAALVAAAMPAALLLGGARLVPAVPMRLQYAEIGTRQQGRRVADPTVHFAHVPGRMMCATAIHAPLGVRDELLHVWRHRGRVVDRIALHIEGGRKDGFRTWSNKRNFGPDPTGAWSCTVETKAGQILGRAGVTVGPVHDGLTPEEGSQK